MKAMSKLSRTWYLTDIPDPGSIKVRKEIGEYAGEKM
jgi:hypothetical protein